MALRFLNSGYFAGKVGIGTDIPDAKLDVRSDSRTAPVVLKLGNGIISGDNGVIVSQIRSYINNSNTAADELARIQVENGSGSHDDGNLSFWTRDGLNNVDAAKQLQINGKGVVELKKSGTAALPVLVLGEDVDTGFFRPSSNNIALSTTGVERVRVTSAGNVGIGDPGPAVKLQVSTNSPANNVAALIGDGWVNNSDYHKEGGLLLVSGTSQDATQTGAGIAFQTRNTANTNYWKSSMIMDRDGAIRFTLGGSGTVAGSEDFTILSGGDVGIGTDSPEQLLELSKSVQGGQGATLRLTNAVGGSGAGVAVEFVGPGTQPIHAKIITEDAGAFDSNLIFQTKATATAGALADRLTIDNVGAIQFNDYGAGTLVSDASGNITVSSGGGAGGPYLPLAGGTLTGPLIIDTAGGAEKMTFNNEYDTAPIADSFIGNTSKSYISFGVVAGSNDPGFIMHESSSVAAYQNMGVLHLCPSDDNSTNDYISIHGSNDPDVLKLHTSGLIETVNLQLQIKSGSGNVYLNDSVDIANNLLVSGAATITSDLTVNGGDIQIDSAFLSNQENTDIDTGAEVVAQVAIATYTAAFFDFVVKKTTNVRSGTVYACHDGTNVEFTETSTNDLGDTSDVTLSVDISGANMRLLATVASDDWSVKSLIRAI